MATFEAQIEGITSLAISTDTTPTQAELTQFLKDGVLDVTKRHLQVFPHQAFDFARETSEQTSNGYDLKGAKIITVLREGNVNNDWKDCRFVPTSLIGKVQDTESLSYASVYNPAYTIVNNGKVNVYPEPGSDPNVYKVVYINNDPRRDSDDAVLEYNSEDIRYFPKDLVHLVVIYASIKVIEAKIASYAVDEEDTELVQAYQSNLQSLRSQYASAFPQMQSGGKDES
tara:strand:+ start:9794 stop:10477 length:684 start_codon:yes stop_codon:yes gene_type:complete